MDPVIQKVTSPKGNVIPAQSSAVRRDRWPSRKAAKESFLRSNFYKAWDSRVLDLWVQYGLRDLPTKVHPDAQPVKVPAGAPTTEPTVTPQPPKDREVTLTTSKHQEVFTFLRSGLPPDSSLVADLSAEDKSRLRELMQPDMPPDIIPDAKMYRPEPMITFNHLPHLRPSVFYIFGDLSPMSSPDFVAHKMEATGTGLGGSGGAPKGRAKNIVLKGVGHLIPMERVGETGAAAVGWIGGEMRQWRKDEALLKRIWDNTSERERYTLSKRVMELMERNLGAGRLKKRPPPKSEAKL